MRLLKYLLVLGSLLLSFAYPAAADSIVDFSVSAIFEGQVDYLSGSINLGQYFFVSVNQAEVLYTSGPYPSTAGWPSQWNVDGIPISDISGSYVYPLLILQDSGITALWTLLLVPEANNTWQVDLVQGAPEPSTVSLLLMGVLIVAALWTSRAVLQRN